MTEDALLKVAVAAAEARDPAAVLSTVVGGLTADAGLALARVWLVAPGGPCDACP
ncbi:MAG: hydrogenase, partial [Deltaproteobacteria bacterium]|nr:hydrogenase [Deltaproteobacteria bacterium]